MKVLSELGVKVVVSGGKMGEMALHFLNQYKIMAVRYPLYPPPSHILYMNMYN